MRKYKSNINPLEKPKIVRAAMEWLIDDYATADIISKIISTWKVDEQEALQLLAEARELCAKSDELQEEILSRRIEGIKKMKRNMSDQDKKTPYGINVLLNLDNSLIRLETLLQSQKDRKKAKAVSEAKRQRLTPKQQLFALEYIKDRNGKQAAIRAGYSERTATVQASRFLSLPHVNDYITDLLEDVRKGKILDGEIALGELIALADWNIKDFMTEDNGIVDISTLPKTKTKPVVAIKSTETISKDGEIKRSTELKFVDKRAAWVDVNRHFGNFEKDNMQKPPPPATTSQTLSDVQFAELLKTINGSHKV